MRNLKIAGYSTLAAGPLVMALGWYLLAKGESERVRDADGDRADDPNGQASAYLFLAGVSMVPGGIVLARIAGGRENDSRTRLKILTLRGSRVCDGFRVGLAFSY